MENRIGVFVCHCGINIASTVDVKHVVDAIKDYPAVVHAEDYKYMCSDPGQNMIQDRMKEKKLNGVIVAACSPTLHEVTFRNTVARAGLNPYRCEIANIREHCSWIHSDKTGATHKAIRIIKTIIEKVKLNDELIPIAVPITKRSLVIGGGIAGIQAALDMANAGYEVILVEKQSSIGGHMAQLSETFPTLDCSQCIMTPRMVEVGHHPNIKLYTYSEVEEISGYVGNFKVKIKKKPKYVDWDKCNGCGECLEICPVRLIDEYDAGLTTRAAIYRLFPQAVPNKVVIDKRGMAPCRFACPAGVNAQGYIALITQGKYKEALSLEREANPFASVCGRVCTHPCEKECERGKVDEPISIRSLKRFIADVEEELESPELPEPKKEKVAIIGSGPAGLTCAYELTKMGYRTTVFEALAFLGGMLRVGIPEFRLPRKEIDKDINYVKSWGVKVKPNTYIKEPEKLLKNGYEAVFIATGAHSERKLGIKGEDLQGVYYGLEFLSRVNTGESVTIGDKIAVVGGGNSAIDAARAAMRLGAKEVTIVYRRSRAEMPAYEEEIVAAEEEGIKIMYLTLPKKIIGKNKVEAMECIKMRLGEPDQTGRRRPIPIEGSEFIIKVDMVIPTIGQIPDLSYLTEYTKLKKTKWNTLVVDDDTLQTTISGIFAGGDVVSGPATIIEGIAAGKKAADSIDRYIKGSDLKVGRENALKKAEPEITPHIVKKLRAKERTLPPEGRINNFNEINLGLTESDAKDEAERCLACGGCAECMECIKVCEPQAIDHGLSEGEIVEEEIGAIVVTTGYDLYSIENIGEYGAGKYKDVINGLQFERLLSASGPTQGEVRRPSDGEVPKRVAFVSCVGSRDPELHKPYCSKVCCMYLTKHAMLYKHRVPDGEPIVFYIDIRSDGKGYEEFVQRAQEQDHVTYIRGKVSKIYENNGKLVIMAADTLSGKPLEVTCDLVVLGMAVVPSLGADELIKKLKIQVDANGFLTEAHPKLRPVETLTPGIFLGGCAQAPRDIPDTVAQASGAASKVLAMFGQEELHHDPMIATVDEDLCSGCGLCITLCPYDARELEIKDEKRIAKVYEVKCEGCGCCIAGCPSGASQQRNVKDNQLLRMVDVAISDKE